ncbi:CotY/CotZ family spore coat protein [Bacillus sp. FJAT-50079]|uniref:CotY/CotZ family spore coat protein n=1 Tax=Bacillus sp. FJAT-50079 TaxID=2833577 RepID=UPI001BCA1901|nr:CotY/CotZ family spore coat protein [Bacillus sp. FJAT-50079]MBS4206947.1 hypothetical protein [Bacillus sp. FJAT-50079]
MKNKQCIREALLELKSLQDLLMESSTVYFGKLLAQLVGTDTIPFILYTENGEFTQTGGERTKEPFVTSYFRIESIEKDGQCATFSLLRPVDLHGNDAHSFCEVMKLIKTSTCIEVDLSCICAIQPLDIEYLKRKIIIEPKW